MIIIYLTSQWRVSKIKRCAGPIYLSVLFFMVVFVLFKNVICHFKFQKLKNKLLGSPKKWLQLWWWGYEWWSLFCDFDTKSNWVACIVFWNYGKNTFKQIKCCEITMLFLPYFYVRCSNDLTSIFVYILLILSWFEN